MKTELIEYMDKILGIVGRVYTDIEFTPRVLEDPKFSPLYEDVGGHIWTLDQIHDSFSDFFILLYYNTICLKLEIIWLN